MNELLTVTEVAQRLRICTRQVIKLSGSGRMPKPIRLARSKRWKADDIARFLAVDCDMARFNDELVSA